MIAEAVPQVLLEGERISSGRIREALVAGDTATATHMLSRDYAIEGVVQRGDARGRELGYPTANLDLGDYQRPKYGIYAVRVTLDDGTRAPRRREPRRPPHLRTAAGTARSPSVRLRRRPLRPQVSRSRSTPTSARKRSSATSPTSSRTCARTRRRRASCWRWNSRHPGTARRERRAIRSDGSLRDHVRGRYAPSQ